MNERFSHERGAWFPVKPNERLLAHTANVAVGTFDCAPDDPHFLDSGPSSTYCFVFPRTHVWIRHAGSEPFLSGPTVATMYNEGQVYERRKASPRGDRCDWCAVTPSLLEDVRARLGDSTSRDSRRLFRSSHTTTDAAIYVRQRRLFERLARGYAVDPIEVEETVIVLLETLLARAHRGSSPVATHVRRRRHETLVDDAKLLLAESVDRQMELAELARRLGCSVFHLCRTFHEVEGVRLHAYRTQLRVRLALEQLVDLPSCDITTTALNLGFCSHSHFTHAFRRAFGITPSSFTSELRTGG